ncbi:hypothetical protein TWF718_007821 [Orbilia javanica]|uniref:Uncharacterized protein n=1 Tax=Orbilia javanica TaxID=47235 RepID=A0AAN8N023_9PEZI
MAQRMASNADLQQHQRRPAASFHHFFRLPRELRDEIYKCILSTPAPEPLCAIMPYIFPTINLAILRVNKQIHEEASEIFYRTAVFPIRISRNDCRSISNGDTIYYISQVTPWEEICYRYKGKNGNFHSPNMEYHLGPREDCPHPNELFPPISYGSRFRKFRIEVADQRKLPDTPGTGLASMRLLSLATDRLSHLLTSETRQDKLTLEIHVAARIFEVDPNFEGGYGTVHDPRMREILVELYRERVYEEMIETVWPLTRGPWEWSIHVPEVLEKQYPHIQNMVLSRCENAEKGTKEEGVWKEPTELWDLWLGWGKNYRYVGGRDELDSLDEDFS